MKNSIYIYILFFHFVIGYSQETKDSIQKIDEIVIESQRIAIAFSKNSHTINIVTAKEISQMPVSTLDEVLQQIIGIDVRRRGVEGMQSDLYIRGGNFNQTLLLIDGVKMDDMQTGHHSMNGIPALDNIERIEVVKGAAARIYGQNAMNGAINIVTKKIQEDICKLSLKAASFDTYGGDVKVQKKIKNTAFLLQINKQKSQGYRYNTDFDNNNAFIKAYWKDFTLVTSYSQRKFGANGFYASPDFKEQYEEIQTHLSALKYKISRESTLVKTSLYWRRNKDRYLFLRQNPSFYQNIHIGNKVGATIDVIFTSPYGKTGLGIDVNQGFLKSNNLGDHKRFSTTTYLEQRFQFFNNHMDITPGIALAYFSDINKGVYPGLDIGYRFSQNLKLYGNTGYTYRIPTYTNLYYNSPAEIGNPNLKPEKAFSNELGLYYKLDNLKFNIALFYRDTSKLIDWVKNNKEDKWAANNIGQVITSGIESEAAYSFKVNQLPQSISIAYTYIDEDIKDVNYTFSRYSLNTSKHQIVTQFKTQFFPFLYQHISYRFHERINGDSYHLLDAAVHIDIKRWQLAFKANNLLNTVYSETNLVPMPSLNFTGEISYVF